MQFRGYVAYAGDVVQIIDEHPDVECVTVRYKNLGFDACVPVQDIESILTSRMSLASPPCQRAIDSAIHSIHMDHGYVAAAFAISDLLRRSWCIEVLALKMICHEIWRNHFEGNPESIWTMRLVPLLQLIQKFVKDYNEVE